MAIDYKRKYYDIRKICEQYIIKTISKPEFEQAFFNIQDDRRYKNGTPNEK